MGEKIRKGIRFHFQYSKLWDQFLTFREKPIQFDRNSLSANFPMNLHPVDNEQTIGEIESDERVTNLFFLIRRSQKKKISYTNL